jgi:hypothetical protein
LKGFQQFAPDSALRVILAYEDEIDDLLIRYLYSDEEKELKAPDFAR